MGPVGCFGQIENIRRQSLDYARIDSLPLEEINVPYPTLAERLMEKTCELCGKEDTELVMHHV